MKYTFIEVSFRRFRVLQHLADYHYKVRYIVAADSSRDTLLRITRKVSQAMAYGKIKIVEPEEAMLNRDVTVNRAIEKENFFN